MKIISDTMSTYTPRTYDKLSKDVQNHLELACLIFQFVTKSGFREKSDIDLALKSKGLEHWKEWLTDDMLQQVYQFLNDKNAIGMNETKIWISIREEISMRKIADFLGHPAFKWADGC